MPEFRSFAALIGTLGLSALLALAKPAAASADPLGFELGLGAVSLPGIEFTHQLRLGYQLPLSFEAVPGQLDAVLSATTAPLFTGLDQLYLAGRYSFGSPEGWQPHLLVGAGIMPIRRNEFALQLGAGLNQWFSPGGFGLSWNASLALPPVNPQLMAINADLSLQWRWDPFAPAVPGQAPAEPAPAPSPTTSPSEGEID